MVYIPKDEMQKIFCTEYVHYRTKKLMRASDYGHKAWYFLIKKK